MFVNLQLRRFEQMRVYKKNFNDDNWEPVNKDELLLVLQY